MPGPEAVIETNFVQHCKALGCYALKLRLIGIRGFPDRTVLAPGGRVFFVEFKAPGGTLSAQQRKWRQILTKLGFVVVVAYDFETAAKELQACLTK